MNIYLLRHGKAHNVDPKAYPDDDRPLTDEGIQKMERAAGRMTVVAEPFDIIVSSPLKRAFQTAEIVSAAMGYKKRLTLHDALLPGSTVEKCFGLIEELAHNRSLLLVGHEPILSRFISSLLGAESVIVEMKKGALCKIECRGLPGIDAGMLKWHLTSRQLRSINGSKP